MTQRSLFDLMPAPPVSTPPVPIAADAPAALTEHCELELVLHYDNAVRGELLVSRGGNEAEAVCLRKAEIEYAATGRLAAATTRLGKPLANGLPVVAVNLPEPLARVMGLLA